MYKIITTTFLFINAFMASAQVTNSGFENWSNGSPDNWETSNVEGSVMPVTQSNDAHSGSYAVRLGVQTAFSFSVPGVISQMDIPISYIPQSFSFWLKSDLEANAEVFGTFAVYDASDVLIGIGYFNVPGSSSTYSEIYVPTNATGSTGQASYCSISISLNSTDGTALGVSNNCTIDDVSISAVSLSIAESKALKISVFPNPCSKNIVNVDLSGIQGQSQIEIVDLQGKVVLSEMAVGGTNHTCDVSLLSNGIYLVKIYAEAEVLTSRLVID